MKSFKQYYRETVEIDNSQFPNPLPKSWVGQFHTKGQQDQDATDDIVKVKNKKWDANKLRPTQQDIYLGKSLKFAIGDPKQGFGPMAGGDIGAVVSKDGKILDGHHRWAATNWNVDPTKKAVRTENKIGGAEANLNIVDLVPVLRAVGDSYGNERSPGGSDKGKTQIRNASADNAYKAITTNKGDLGPNDSGGTENRKAWLKRMGGDTEGKQKRFLHKRLNWFKQHQSNLQQTRDQMPVINKNQIDQTAGLLNRGDIDVRKPYAKGWTRD